MISEAGLDQVVREASAVLVAPGALRIPGYIDVPGLQAVTILYKEDTMNCPQVTSKTRGGTAWYVIQHALESGVYVLESQLVWRLQTTDLGEDVPPHTWLEVADALALAQQTGNSRTARMTAKRRIVAYDPENWLCRLRCRGRAGRASR
jgi:type III secretion system FlhB-like substrate exporter